VSIVFTFEGEDIDGREIVMLESEYERMVQDIRDLESELDHAKNQVAALLAQAEKEGIHVCDCDHCVREYLEEEFGGMQ